MTNVNEMLATNSVSHFDVVISGGGLSGSLMALSLAGLTNKIGESLSIAIVEASPISNNIPLSFDDRVLALSHGTAAYLESLGAWDILKKDAQAIKTIHISDQGHYGKARIVAKEHNVSALGYVVEMKRIGKSLLSALSEKKTKSNITWFAPDSITAIQWQKSVVEIRLSSGQQISAKLLLGCDGGHSVCRKLANISMTEVCYGQSALIANVSTSIPHHNVAFERFTQTGPIAMLPLSDSDDGKGRCSLVWTLTPDLAQELITLNDSDFKVALEKTFGSWLGGITTVGKRDVYPLKLIQAQEQVYHRMVLIGNASHTIHPIAGQGFNLGVRDVQQLTQVIKSAIANAEDIGRLSLLSLYADGRKNDHQQVISLTDSLVTLFSNKLPPLIAGRNIGLKVLNYVTPLKNALVKKTMGY